MWYYTASGSATLVIVAVKRDKNFTYAMNIKEHDYVCTVLTSAGQLFTEIVFPLDGWLQA